MGTLSTHVLNTASGEPGVGIPYKLTRLGTDSARICAGVTNEDGRTDGALLSEERFELGTYELLFTVGDYFASKTMGPPSKPFLDEIVIRFSLGADEHYHVPLLVSPWSYSTYRGS